MERAECVVVYAATELFSELRRVEDWPQFTEGLVSVVATGHHRYRWGLVYAGHRREVDVVLSFDHRTRRISWKALRRPAFDGGLRLVPLDAHRTRVYAWLTVEPVGLVENLLAGPHLTNAMAARNLQRLAEWVASRPEPARRGAVVEDIPIPRRDQADAAARLESRPRQ